MSNLSRYTLEDGSQVDNIPRNYTGSFIYEHDSKWWYQQGKLHRIDGPAIEYTNGNVLFYYQGKLHRIGGPVNGIQGKDWAINDQVIDNNTKIVLLMESK
jgi:hypothetical protein